MGEHFKLLSGFRYPNNNHEIGFQGPDRAWGNFPRTFMKWLGDRSIGGDKTGEDPPARLQKLFFDGEAVFCPPCIQRFGRFVNN